MLSHDSAREGDGQPYPADNVPDDFAETYAPPADPPPPTEDTRRDHALIVAYRPERLALIDGMMAYCDDKGWYIDAGAKHANGVLQNLILDARRRAGIDKDVTGQAASTCGVELRRYVDRPPAVIARLTAEAFVNHYLHDANGGAIDLTAQTDDARHLTPEMTTMRGVALRWTERGVLCDYAGLDKQPAAIADIEEWYGRNLLKRMARNLLLPGKTIDSFTTVYRISGSRR